MIIFWLFVLVIISQSQVNSAVNHPYSYCYSNGNLSNNTYIVVRNFLLSKLADDVNSNGGFYVPQEQRRYFPLCLGLCREDRVSSDACHPCISNAVSDILHNCPVQKQVVAWDPNAGCIVRCGPPNQEFEITQQHSTYSCNSTSFPLNYLSQFNHTLNDLTSKLALKAAAGGGSSSSLPVSSTEEAKLGQNLTIYAAGFCVRTLSESECTSCLRTAANQSAVNCNGKQGAKIFLASCVLRYELYPFYSSATTVSVAPLPPASPLPSASPSSGKKGKKKRIVVFAVCLPIAAVIIITTLRMTLNRRSQSWDLNDDMAGHEGTSSCFEMSFSTIRVATNDFSESNKLGQGGFGAVYKGRLPNGRLVAIKRLTRTTAHGEVEFKNEVQLVARLHHKNLVRLIGFCVGVRERILIYELAINGSLDHILFDPNRRKNLTWKIRFKIVEGIAHGLLYLHEESQLRIIHRDLKAGNVLLDESMNPKISDFGTARLYVEDQGSASRIVGTYGYMPPEYAKFGKISTKVDVFSFGVLLLEIVSGRRNSTSPRNPKQIEHLLSKAWKCWKEGQLQEVIDPVLLRENGQTDDITRRIHMGLLCVQEKVACRPTMSEVVLMLEDCSQILPPPSEPAYLMEIVSEESDVLTPRINASDVDHPTGDLMLSSSVNEVSFTNTYPEPR